MFHFRKEIKKWCGITMFFFAAVIFLGSISPANAITNPIIDWDYPDPHIIQVGEMFYMYATNGGTVPKNLRVIRSTDLVEWETMPDAMPTRASWIDTVTPRIWAPGVIQIATNQFVLYYSAFDSVSQKMCIGRASASAPEGPFVDSNTAAVICDPSLGGDIGPQPFRDGEKLYLYYKLDGNASGLPTRIYVQELSADGLSFVGNRMDLIHNDQAWEGAIVEAPQMLKHDGLYYLFYSGALYCTDRYSVGYAVCQTALGPCTKPLESENRILKSQPTHNPPLNGPGTIGLIETNGQTWVLYNSWSEAVEEDCKSIAGNERQVFISPLQWVDGKPVMTPHLPAVTTQPASFISTDSATVNATLTDDGGENATVEIQWGTTSGIYPNTCSASFGPDGDYACEMTGLSLDTKYYYRAKATNSATSGYGLEKSFTTNVAYQAFQRKILDMADISVLKISDQEFYVTGTSGGRIFRVYRTTDMENFSLFYTFDPSAIDGAYDYCSAMGLNLAFDSDNNIIASFAAVLVANGFDCSTLQQTEINQSHTIYQSRMISNNPWTFTPPYGLHYLINGVHYGTEAKPGVLGPGETVFKIGPMVRDGRIYYTWFDQGNNLSSIGLASPHDLVTHTKGGDTDEYINETNTVFTRNGLSYMSFNRYDWRNWYTPSYLFGNTGMTSLVRAPGAAVLDIAQPIHTAECALPKHTDPGYPDYPGTNCVYENAGHGDVFSRYGQYYFFYHKAFPKEDRMKRSAYLTPLYFDTDGRIISITTTTLHWDSMGAGVEYSLAVKPNGENWIAPCINAGVIQSNTQIDFGGLCQNTKVVHKGEVEQFRVCYSSDNWESSKCKAIDNDVTKDSLFVDFSFPSAPTGLSVL